jgi:hypothetical protein
MNKLGVSTFLAVSAFGVLSCVSAPKANASNWRIQGVLRMLSRDALLVLFASFFCLASSVQARASAITIGTDYYMSVSSYASGEQDGGSPDYYIGYTTITLYADKNGVIGAEVAQYNQAFCIDIFDQINSKTPPYIVQAQGVGTAYDSALYPTTASGLKSYLGATYYNEDGSVTTNNDALAKKLDYDAVLGAEFTGHNPNDTNIQEDIWDEGGGSFTLNQAALNAVNQAQNYVNSSSSFASGDIAFLEMGGDGQSFMVNTHVVPEPSTLILFGSGLLTAAGALYRRKRRTA